MEYGSSDVGVYKQMSSVQGQLGVILGREREETLVSTMNKSSEKPEWFQNSFRGSLEDDKKGIDVIVETDVGHLFLQVKSSKKEARLFRRKYEKRDKNQFKAVACVVFTKDKTNDLICEHAFHLLELMRNDILLYGETPKLIYNIHPLKKFKHDPRHVGWM
jgi:hypothetical protein